MHARRILGVALIVCVVGLTSAARARPSAPAIVCQSLPDLSECAGTVVGCPLCHESTDPPTWNPFGASIQHALQGASFEQDLPRALMAVEGLDSDGDGVSNLEELEQGTQPGKPDALIAADSSGAPNPRYRLGQYDAAFAYRRVMTLYCGRSPRYDELQALAAGDDPRAMIHAALTECLRSDFWRKEQLPRLADKRIRPLRAIGSEAVATVAGFRLVVGDYQFDYRMWQFVLSNDRDMRELLTADYFVLQAEDGSLVQTWDTIEAPDLLALGGGQLVERGRRAGMITSQWFLAFNTMFSVLPRSTAAQAYRAYLGTDIAASEGLFPVAREPVDIDKKGVANPRCATCHSTLDPLAYAFMAYEGIELTIFLPFGAYNANRGRERLPGWDDAKQVPYLFGQPVKDLIQWAHVAAESDAFARNMAEVFFEHALGRKPELGDQPEFAQLWKSCRADGYSANRLIARLVDTLSFGAP